MPSMRAITSLAARCRRSTASDRTICRSTRWSSGRASPQVKEVVIALSATVDGQSTAHYITDLLARGEREGDAARPRRAGRRRARLSRRRHARRRHAQPDAVLIARSRCLQNSQEAACNPIKNAGPPGHVAKGRRNPRGIAACSAAGPVRPDLARHVHNRWCGLGPTYRGELRLLEPRHSRHRGSIFLSSPPCAVRGGGASSYRRTFSAHNHITAHWLVRLRGLSCARLRVGAPDR